MNEFTTNTKQNPVESAPIADEAFIYQYEHPVWVTRSGDQLQASLSPASADLAAYLPAILPENLGDPAFRQTYRLKYAGYAGAMANAISSEKMVIEMANAGFHGYLRGRRLAS